LTASGEPCVRSKAQPLAKDAHPPRGERGEGSRSEVQGRAAVKRWKRVRKRNKTEKEQKGGGEAGRWIQVPETKSLERIFRKLALYNFNVEKKVGCDKRTCMKRRRSQKRGDKKKSACTLLQAGTAMEVG